MNVLPKTRHFVVGPATLHAPLEMQFDPLPINLRQLSVQEAGQFLRDLLTTQHDTHPYLSMRWRSAVRARCNLDMTVPTGMVNTRAISQ